MIVHSQDKQFSLSAGGNVHWQKDPTNPLTGPIIGSIRKGRDILNPDLDLVEGVVTPEDKEQVFTHVQEWLQRYIRSILSPLFLLADGEGIDGSAKDIAQKVYDALGILPRDQVQGLIDQLTEEGRAALRKRKLRMGPLLIYLPELNKPAAVRLQAMLWALWHDLGLPAQTPADGMVSFSVRDQVIDPAYYRAIGYPVYGPRAIRVDMLDRVVCAVYDSAKEGKFKAQHQMAEWLGCTIADLYEVLGAMGHRKIHDPLEEKIKAEAESIKAPETPETPAPVAEQETQGAAVEGQAVSIPKPAAERPELATFALKRGRASEAQAPKAERAENKKPRFDKKKKDASSTTRPEKTFEKKSDFKKKHRKGRNKDDDREERGERVIKAWPKSKPEDSPFAILQKLKLGSDDQ